MIDPPNRGRIIPYRVHPHEIMVVEEPPLTLLGPPTRVNRRRRELRKGFETIRHR